MGKSKRGCFDFKAGSCSRGDDCRFSHAADADYAAQPAQPKKSKGGFVKQQQGTFERQLPEANQKLPQTFVDYYSAQRIVAADQWDDFAACARTPLPVTLRVSKSYPKWELTVAELAANPNLRQLAWYPDGLAWQCSNEYFEQNQEWHDWVRESNFSGALAFQEAVSMIPPLCLQIESSDLVLDMCAAPGSKTLQVLDMLHQGDSVEVGLHTLATGAVIANELDAGKACQVLAARVGKARSHSCVVTSRDAGTWPPFLQVAVHEGEGEHGERLLFDKVVCDVPCSGDGTIRKNPSIARTWELKYSLSLHPKQLKILGRGLYSLRGNGLLVYSTCTLNPIENEAVVLAALTKHPGFELVPVPQLALSVEAGCRVWGVPDYTADSTRQLFSRWEQVPEQLRHPEGKLHQSMFSSAPEATTQQLSNCIRVLPHKNDTGGFFVALFRRCPHDSTVQCAAPPESDAATPQLAPPHCLYWDNPSASSVPPAPLAQQQQQPSLLFTPTTRPSSQVRTVRWIHQADADKFKHTWSAVTDGTEAASSWLKLSRWYGIPQSMDRLTVLAQSLDGVIRRFNLVSEGLALLSEHAPTKGVPMVSSLGLEIFCRFRTKFLKYSVTRFHPSQQAAALLARVISRRRVRIEQPLMQVLLEKRELDIRAFIAAHEEGRVTGLEGCCPEGQQVSYESLEVGGMVVGVCDGSSIGCDRYFWLACVLTDKSLKLYANTHEVAAIQQVFAK